MVTLFNAIKKHQKNNKAEELKETMKKISQQEVIAQQQHNIQKQKVALSSNTWKVLDDNYMIQEKSSMKNWDKEIDSDFEDDEDEKEEKEEEKQRQFELEEEEEED